MPSFLRFASITVALLSLASLGNAQIPGQRYDSRGYPMATYPAAPYQPGAIPATGLVGPTPATPSERMSIVDPDKKLSAGDQVTVQIIEDRDQGFQRMVTATGELDVPPLGRVKVTGKTVAEAASDIKVALEKDYYYHATVRVAIDRVSPIAVRAGVVFLSGEVRLIGPMEMVVGEPLTLCNAILKAGGPTEWASKNKVRLMRQKDGKTVTTEVDYDKIIKSGDVNKDPILQDGDRIYVPKAWVRF